MNRKQEIKNFTNYRKQVIKLAKFVSLNQSELTLHLLVHPYKVVKSLGRKYCDKTNDDLQANYIDGMPDWSNKDCRKSLTLDDYYINYRDGDVPSPKEPYRDYYQYTADIDPYLVGIIFNWDRRSDPKSYGSMILKLGRKHGLQIVKEVGMHDPNERKYTISNFIDYLKVLADILQLYINRDKKVLVVNKAQKNKSSVKVKKSPIDPVNYNQIEKEQAKIISNGKYSWDKIMN